MAIGRSNLTSILPEHSQRVTFQRLLVESGLWDAVVDAPDYRATTAMLKGGAVLIPTPKTGPKWRKEDGIIYFSVTSNGLTGEEWITRLEAKGNHVSPYAKQLLHSDDFKPTNGITTEVAVLPGLLFTDENRFTKDIRAEAKKRKFVKSNPEVACLIREMFTDEELAEMGLWWIIVMHSPIEDSDGGPGLLGASRGDDGRWLYACCSEPLRRWNRVRGFAFAAPRK